MEAMCKLVVVQHRLSPMTKYQHLLESLMKNNKVTDHVINDLGENVDKTVLKTDLRVVKKKYDKVEKCKEILKQFDEFEMEIFSHLWH